MCVCVCACVCVCVQESDVAARRADEERRAEQERKRKVAASWTAHKGPDGQV